MNLSKVSRRVMTFKLQERSAYGSVTGVNKKTAKSFAEQLIDSLGTDSLDDGLRKIEIQAVAVAMRRARNNGTFGAEILNLKRTTMGQKRKRFGLFVREQNPRRSA